MNRLLLPLCLTLAACMPMHARHHDGEMFEHKERPWPTVRIDEPAGALVVMSPGVFGEGLHAKAPLEGKFQPTARPLAAGYPLELLLDEATAQRYGSSKSVVVYARLNVAPSFRRHGTLLIKPSECALRALVAGDLDELRVQAEVLPTADEVCAQHAAGEATKPEGCAMGACPMGGAAHSMSCPHGHGMSCMHGRATKACCGHGARAGAVLTLRMTKF